MDFPGEAVLATLYGSENDSHYVLGMLLRRRKRALEAVAGCEWVEVVTDDQS